MIFMTLTRVSGSRGAEEPIDINFELVESLHPTKGDGTTIVTQRGSVHEVKESRRWILIRLKRAGGGYIE